MSKNGIRSFWDIHPEIRDLAARLDADGVNSQAIRQAIGERFGDELVPSNTQVCALRRGIVKGRWQVPAEEPSVAPAPDGKKSTKLHFWDVHEHVRDMALCLLPFENGHIMSELHKRFEFLPRDTSKQLRSLRYGVLTGRWQVPDRPILPKTARKTAAKPTPEASKPAEVPDKAVGLLNQEWVGCQIRGVVCLSGRACLTRQLSAAERHTGRTWRIDQGHRALHPGFRTCSECPNWLSDEELTATSAIMHGTGPPRRAVNGERIL